MTAFHLVARVSWALISCGCAAADFRVVHETFSSGGKTIHTAEYRPSAAEQRGLAIILHGSGGLESRNFPYAGLAASLASRGIYVRVPHYFDAVRPKAGKVESQYGAWVEVVRSAIGKHGGAALIGFSLGASIGLAAAAADSRIAAVIDCAGSMPDEYFLHLKQLPPVFILHNRGDPVMPYFNSEQLLQLCKARRYDCRTRIGDGSFHGLPAPGSESIDQIVRFVLTRAN